MTGMVFFASLIMVQVMFDRLRFYSLAMLQALHDFSKMRKSVASNAGTNSILIYKSIVLHMELTETLRTFIEEGADWERKQTSVRGVSIIRLPATKNRAASLAIDINPLGANGLPMKKKGIMIMNSAEIAAFRAAFNNEKVDSLVAALEDVLPDRKTAGKPAKSDVLQI
jgi:hypothetical protein